MMLCVAKVKSMDEWNAELVSARLANTRYLGTTIRAAGLILVTGPLIRTGAFWMQSCCPESSTQYSMQYL